MKSIYTGRTASQHAYGRQLLQRVAAAATATAAAADQQREAVSHKAQATSAAAVWSQHMVCCVHAKDLRSVSFKHQ